MFRRTAESQFVCGGLGISFTAFVGLGLTHKETLRVSGLSLDECLALCLQDPSGRCDRSLFPFIRVTIHADENQIRNLHEILLPNVTFTCNCCALSAAMRSASFCSCQSVNYARKNSTCVLNSASASERELSSDPDNTYFDNLCAPSTPANEPSQRSAECFACRRTD